MKIKFKYQNFIAILFFIFFTTPILSPAINNNTIYLHWFIPFLDIKFIQYIMNFKLKKQYIITIFIMGLSCLLLGKIFVALKMFFLIETILYLFYCKKEEIFKYLYWGINFNIVVAIFQFAFYYISPDISRMLGPTNISKMIWGKYATQSFTNIYVIFKMVRVSGWSREAGFFASLIIISFIIYINDKENKRSKLQYIMFIIAFIISFSKSSYAILLLFIVIKFRKYIDKVPYIIRYFMYNSRWGNCF